MSTIAPNVAPERSESFASDLAGMFSFLFDPQGAARRLPRKWFWVAPTLLCCIAFMIYSAVSSPILSHYMQTAPIPNGVNPDQYAQMLRMQEKFAWVGMIVAPLMVLFMFVIFSALTFAVSSMFAIQAKFGKIFNLFAGCSIFSAIQALVWALILKMKGEISATSEIRPPLGLDIFLPDGTSKLLMGIASYFSIFQIWYIVMIVLIFSIGFRVSKGKAMAVITPAIVLGLAFTILGTVFQK